MNNKNKEIDSKLMNNSLREFYRDFEFTPPHSSIKLDEFVDKKTPNLHKILKQRPESYATFLGAMPILVIVSNEKRKRE